MKKTLVLGASPDPIRFSYKAIKSLLRYGHPVVALGNKEGDIQGVQIQTGQPSVEEIDTVALYLNPYKQKEYYQYLIALQPRRIIFNPGTENNELMDLASQNGIQVVEDCTLIMLNTDRY
jgi:uncharacterized protein